MLTRSHPRIALAAALTCTLLLTHAGTPSAALGAASGKVTTPATDASANQASKVITVDGQQVRVTVIVARFDATAGPTPHAQTSGSVVLESVVDGQALPDGLSARNLKLERVRAPLRIFNQPLNSIARFRADPTSSRTIAYGDPAFRAGSLLKATIRLKTSTGVRYVRVDNVRVAQE